MCCKIDLKTQNEAAHFLGKNKPNALTQDNASSLFERLLARFFNKSH